jgi:hypothetical protein
LVDGEKVTAETTFTDTESSGSVEVVFTFDSTGLDGKTLVVFEWLYYEDSLIAEHTDIDDEAQTVTVDDIPPTQTTPPPPGSPQTGQDGLPTWLLIVFLSLVVAAVGLTIYTIMRWKDEKDD